MKNSEWAADVISAKLADLSGINAAGLTINTNYWLDDKTISSHSEPTGWTPPYTYKTYTDYNIRYLNGVRRLYSSNGSQSSYTDNVRAIIVMKGWVYVEGGSGTREDPYILKRSTHINLQVRADNENNQAIAYFEHEDKVHQWRYQMFQKRIGGKYTDVKDWEEVALYEDGAKKVNVLNVYPSGDSKGRKISQIVDKYGKDWVNLTEVPLSKFNSNPNAYINNSYDVIIFGINHMNGPGYSMGETAGQDLSGKAVKPLLEYAKNGGSIILGPDTAMQWRHSHGCSGNSNEGHRGFQNLAGQFGVGTEELKDRHGSFQRTSSVAKITMRGSITRFPYVIGDTGSVDETFKIVPTHNAKMSMNGKNTNTWVISNGVWYLKQRNNFAVCHMGIDGFSDEEAKLMINLLVSMKQNAGAQEKEYILKSAQDLDAPDAPDGRMWHLEGSDTNYLYKVYEPKDNGTTYQHCVVGTYSTGTMLPDDIVKAIANNTALADNMIKSNITTTTILTGMAGYSYTITKGPSKDVDAIIDKYLYDQTNVPNIYIQKGYVKKEDTLISIPKQYINNGYYLNIVAVDKAGNKSSVFNVKLDYIHRQLVLTSKCEQASEIDTRGVAAKKGDSKIALHWQMNPDDLFKYEVYEIKEADADYHKIDAEHNHDLYTGADLAAPERPKIQIRANIFDYHAEYPLNLIVEAPDKGTSYDHFVVGISENKNTQTEEPIWSNAVRTTICTGTEGFSWIIDSNPNTIPDDNIETLR